MHASRSIYLNKEDYWVVPVLAVAGIGALLTFSEYANAPAVGDEPMTRSNLEWVGVLAIAPVARGSTVIAAASARGVTKGVDDLFKAGRTPKASELTKCAEQQGWKPSQTANGPLKYIDENDVNRLTMKQGGSRAPGSANPHVELRNASG